MIDWKLITLDEPPPINTHLLTCNANLDCPTIFHNITDSSSRFIGDYKEQGYVGLKHNPTHYASMNFP